ncbi:MAG: proline racemase family protein [Calditrichia bacterium]
MKDILQKLRNWESQENRLKITTLDAHTGGEPLRIILDGLPEIPGATILEKRRYLMEHLDNYRKLLMWEPRGHADMYGCIITEPNDSQADFGVIFLHNEGYSTMCGHAIIAVSKVVVQCGAVSKSGNPVRLTIDAPAGRVYSKVYLDDRGKVQRVSFKNVPSFIYKEDVAVAVADYPEIVGDIVFGGAFYFFVDADRYGVDLSPKNYRRLIELGMELKQAVMARIPIHHPEAADLGFLYGTISYGKSHTAEADSRNVCIFAEGEVDRSPTGTGVSARMALHHYKHGWPLGKPMTIESIVGSRFTATPLEEVEYHGFPAVIPEVSGNAFISGKNQFYLDPEDDFPEGFFLR